MAASHTDLIWMSGQNPVRAAWLSTQDEKHCYPQGVFVVRSWGFASLISKINAVNRKLAKYGKPPVEPISWKQKVYRKTMLEVLEDGRKVETPVGSYPYLETLIAIDSAVIQLSDRQAIVGTIDRIGDSDDMVVKPFVKQADDAAATEALVAEVGREIRCDHCHSNRRRNGAWILRNPDHTLSMIAKSCGKEFFGLNVASLLNDLIDLDETEGGFTRATFDRIELVALVIGVVLKHGFVSQTVACNLNSERIAAGLGEVKSTRALVGEYQDAKAAHAAGARSDTYDVAKALAAVELVKANLELANSAIEAIAVQQTRTNFEANCQAVIRSMSYAKDWYPNEALVVAGIAAYLKAEGFELPNVWAFKEAAKTPEQRSAALPFAPAYVGQVGSKIHGTATVEAAKWYENQWGGGYVFILRTADNRKLVYFGSSAVWDPTSKTRLDLGDVTIGSKLDVHATVKDQKIESYRGVDSHATVINRPVFTLIPQE